MASRTTFVKVYDDIGDHPGFMAVSAEGLGLWLQALTYCHRNSTDGHFPQRAIDRWGALPDTEAPSVLISEGRWHLPGHDCGDCPQPAAGYAYVHGYLEVHRSKEQIAELSAARAESGRQGGIARSRKQVAKQGAGNGKQTSSRSKPEIEVEVDNNTPAAAAADPDGFAEFWSIYPKREGRKAAVAAYRRALRDTDHATIMAGLRSTVALWQAERRDRQYVPHPTTWLNQGRWADEHPTLPGADPAQQRPATLMQCTAAGEHERHPWADDRNRYLCQGA